jgi:hypothetical protein
MVAQIQRKASSVHFVFIDERPVSRFLIENKKTALRVLQIRVGPGNKLVIHNLQIIFWASTDVKDAFVHQEPLSFNGTSHSYQYGSGLPWGRGREVVAAHPGSAWQFRGSTRLRRREGIQWRLQLRGADRWQIDP